MATPESREDKNRALAVALAYAPGDSAPKVVAKGRGLIAEAIIERAKTHGIFVHESPELVALLLQVDIDVHIPPQLYVAIAELLAWLYELEEESGGKPGNLAGKLGNKSSQ